MLITRYILRQLIGALIAITFVLTFIIWLTQSLRFLELMVAGGAPMTIFGRLVILSLPKFLEIVLPIALTGAILFIYTKLINDREFNVMRAAGIRDNRLGRPAIILAIGVTAIVLSLSLVVTPLSKEKLDRETDFIKSNLSTLLLREGVFNDISDDLTVYIRDRVDAVTMRGILIHDRGSADRPITILAQQGKLYTPSGGAPQIIITDGLRQEFDPDTGNLRRLSFDQYSLDLGRFSSPPGPIRLDIDERSVFSLIDDLRSDISNNQRDEIIADLVSRTGLPLMTLAFAYIALACLMAGDFSRAGNLRRIFLAVILVTCLQGVGLGLSNLIAGHLIFAPLMYVLAIGPMIMAWAVLSQDKINLVGATK